jgi:hypothetical protein
MPGRIDARLGRATGQARNVLGLSAIVEVATKYAALVLRRRPSLIHRLESWSLIWHALLKRTVAVNLTTGGTFLHLRRRHSRRNRRRLSPALWCLRRNTRPLKLYGRWDVSRPCSPAPGAADTRRCVTAARPDSSCASSSRDRRRVRPFQYECSNDSWVPGPHGASCSPS